MGSRLIPEVHGADDLAVKRTRCSRRRSRRQSSPARKACYCMALAGMVASPHQQAAWARCCEESV